MPKTAKKAARPKKSAPRRVTRSRKTAPAKPALKPTRIKLLSPVPSDIDIAQAGKLKTILQIAEEVGLKPGELELYGPYKAKVHLDVRDRLARRKNGKYVVAVSYTHLTLPTSD